MSYSEFLVLKLGTFFFSLGAQEMSRVYRAIHTYILGGFGRLGRACPGHGEALREKIEGPARRLRHTTLSGIVHLQKPHLSNAVLTRMLCASSQAAIRAIRSRDVGANMSQSVEESIDEMALLTSEQKDWCDVNDCFDDEAGHETDPTGCECGSAPTLNSWTANNARRACMPGLVPPSSSRRSP